MYQKYVELRDKKGVSDYRVAMATGVTKSTFTDWKSGRSKPKFDKLLAIARYFGVSVEYFADDYEEEKGEDT
ncbi:helix-turn-helix domain-containing protein [Hungatella hathewayi]|uniref:helix-turn-helix domain-containing protein n=1 Tax=Hungatella hathewayi TaxID=154046 RepID=UPI003566B36B